MTKFFFPFIFILSSPLFGQHDNSALGASSAGIAGASVTSVDLWAVQNNQAALTFIENTSIGVYYENRFLLDALSLQSFAIAVPTKSGNFGMSANVYGYSLYRESKYGLAYGRKLNDKLSLGIRLNYLTTQIGSSEYGKRSAINFELGILTFLTPDLSLGVHVYNPLQTKLAEYTNEKTPSIFRTGLNYKFSKKVFAALEVEKRLDTKPVFKLGTQYDVNEKIILRAGIATNPALSTFGVGFNFGKLQLNIASSIHSTLGYSPQVGMNYELR